MPTLHPSDPSGSLVQRLSLEPTASGPLDGLTFTVKDNIDLAGLKTSYGNPAWRDFHPAPNHNALCVDALLAAGGRCVGKAIADEFTYSLQGENPWFGTPLNHRAPDRIPGGSSSGSAASVANGVADFSLGTDSGGSIRVPASFCGIWGMRPSLHRISEAGVLPFMPSVSTVGVVSNRFEHLDKVVRTLLSGDEQSPSPLKRVFVLADAMDICDDAVQSQAEKALVDLFEPTGIKPEPIRLAQIVGEDLSLRDCNERTLRPLQTLEFQNTLGSWIEYHKPETGLGFSMAYENVRQSDRLGILDCRSRRERIFDAMRAWLTPGTVICFPSTPMVAPLKGTLETREAARDFYDRTMAITAFAGIGRLPEISAPLLSASGCPVGLSIAAGNQQDESLLCVLGQLLG